MSVVAVKRWVKARRTPAARAAYAVAAALRGARVPVIRPLHRALYGLHLGVKNAAAEALRVLWWTPLFVSRLETAAPGLRLFGGMPQVLGPLRLRLGRGVRMSGATTLIGRSATIPDPLLEIGDNVDIGWQSQISVGTRVVIGDNVRLAGRCMPTTRPPSHSCQSAPPWIGDGDGR